ncbi:uncharacterized protein LOC131145881 [Malania oleifera]|uniref:uncharacterized protein LOC131145881 n=1 Tax=Malania oleifera TaxID=397392 RepID=UPI0025ADEB2A|nr:uncharacterized protein LOC131145881 [Malania oleifera]
MPSPKSEKEVRSFLGRLNYIARFISQLTTTCEPIFKLLRKNSPVKWNEECQVAFEKIKEYLLNPPVLVPPVPGRPLILYLAISENSMGCLLGQHDETGRKEKAIYYLSKKFTDYKSRKVIKGSVIAKYLDERVVEDYQPMEFEFPDQDIDSITQGGEDPEEWMMLFDGAINVWGHGIGAVLISLDGKHYPVYGIPERIITDNAKNLNNAVMTKLCNQFKVKHHISAPYRPQMNEAVEAANKNIKNILEKMTETYRNWHDKLPFALMAYRTTARTFTGATPFSLVYMMEAVVLVEVEIPSLRVLNEVELTKEEWV